MAASGIYEFTSSGKKKKSLKNKDSSFFNDKHTGTRAGEQRGGDIPIAEQVTEKHGR